MASALSVTITNNSCPRALSWLVGGTRWINKSLDVDFEPWSCASVNERRNLQVELKTGAVKFTMHLTKPDGTVVDIDYNPAYAPVIVSKPIITKPVATTATAASTSATKTTVASAGNAITTDGSSHIIIAGGSSAEVAGLGAVITKPGVVTNAENPKSAPADDTYNGFKVQSAPSAPVSDIEEETKEEESAAEITENGTEDAAVDEDIAEQFNALIAARKLADALKLLIKVHGADKITCTANALKSVKDYAGALAKLGIEA